MQKSALFRVRELHPYPRHYSVAFAFSAILYPQQNRPILQPDLSSLATRLHYGLTLFRAWSMSQEGSTFLPMTVLSACPHQAGMATGHVPFGQSPIDFGSFRLDGIYQWFT